MKRNDITTGVIYAVKRGGSVDEAVVLSTEGDYQRPSRFSHSTIGPRAIGGKHYLVLLSRNIAGTKNLLGVAATIDGSKVERSNLPSLPEGYSFDVLLPQAFLGEHSEYERQREEGRQAARDREAEAEGERAARRALEEEAIARTKRFPGMERSFVSARDGRISLPIEQLHLLLDAAGVDK